MNGREWAEASAVMLGKWRKKRKMRTMSYEEQVKMFKDMIPIGPIPTSELIKRLEAKVDLKEIACSALSPAAIQAAVYNAGHCILNQDLRLNPDDMLFRAFQVVRNEKSEPYDQAPSLNGAAAFVIFEERTGYLHSNSNRLFLELELARGVSQQEYDTEGLEFRSLLSHLAIAHCEEQDRKEQR